MLQLLTWNLALSGFIASGMMAGRFFSSVPWGRFADIYGRKPALISGCMSISAFSIMFGMSTSLVTAVIARFLLGLFNPVWLVLTRCSFERW